MDALLSFPGQSDTPDTPESGITHLGDQAELAGQQQPRPLRRDGVEQAGHARVRDGPPGGTVVPGVAAEDSTAMYTVG